MDLRHYKRTPLYIVSIIFLCIGFYILYSIQLSFAQWRESHNNQLALLVFISISVVGPGLFYLFFSTLNISLWKYKLTNLLINIPDLNGRYEGTIDSVIRKDNKSTTKQCAIEITQTAIRISINMYVYEADNDHFSSCSNIHSILTIDADSVIIYYMYRNEKDAAKIQDSSNISMGLAMLEVSGEANDVLVGNYFNKRGNTGRISVKFNQRKKIHRLKRND